VTTDTNDDDADEIHVYANEDGYYTVAYYGDWQPGLYTSRNAARAVCGLDPRDIEALWDKHGRAPLTLRQVKAWIGAQAKEMTPEEEAGLPVFEMLQQMPDSPLREMVERALRIYLQRIRTHELDGPSAHNEIVRYIHCAQCIEECKTGQALGQSPAEYAQLSVGFTSRGMQIWCNRHDINVCHIDYEGCQHPANMTSTTPGQTFDA
jgi:hypothetical protein